MYVSFFFMTVCTVEYGMVDSIANTKLSILVRPMCVVERSRYYAGKSLGIRLSDERLRIIPARIFDLVITSRFVI